MNAEFEQINNGFNKVFKPHKLTLGVFFAIESYKGSIPTMQDQVELAQLAEQLGFSALWSRDVPMHDPSFGDVGQIYDPWVYLGYIAAQTKEIALVTGSIVLPLRHPIHVAKAAASVDQLSNGRLVLGVASGDRPSEYSAFNQDVGMRGELFRESFQYISRLTEHFPVLDSYFGKLNGYLDLLPKPAEKKIPMLVTGHSGGQTLQWIAQNADGWIYYPRGVHAQLEIVKSWRNTLQSLDVPDKPFAQSFYIDLVRDPDQSPTPIHLGVRVGRKYLTEILHALQHGGVNHVVFNLKYGSRQAREVLEELGAHILPQFRPHLQFSEKSLAACK